MTTATPTRPNTSDLQGQVLVDAGRRMLPVLTSRLLAAVADRAEAGIDSLSDRLGELAENGGSRRERPAPAASDTAEAPSGGLLTTVWTMAIQQARVFLDLVVRLLAQAAAAARTAAERLRARRAPEGIDDEPDPAALEGAEDEPEDDEEQATVAG